MTIRNFADLAKFAAGPMPAGYPGDEHVSLLAPDDALYAALAFFIDQAAHSLSLGLPDLVSEQVAMAIVRKLQAPGVLVQLCADSLNEPGYGTYGESVMTLAQAPGNIVSSRWPHPGMTGSADGLDSFTGSRAAVTFARHPVIAFQARCSVDRAIAGDPGRHGKQ